MDIFKNLQSTYQQLQSTSHKNTVLYQHSTYHSNGTSSAINNQHLKRKLIEELTHLVICSFKSPYG